MRLVKPAYEILAHSPYVQMLNTVCHMIGHCYKASVPKDTAEQEQFIQARVKLGHESVIEHVGFSVDFVVDRGITHELVRHRLSSFTQSSTRYCNYSDEKKFNGHVPFVMPPFVSAVIPAGTYDSVGKPCGGDEWVLIPSDGTDPIRIQDETVLIWLSAMKISEDHYRAATIGSPALLPPELARGVLPQSTMTVIGVTANMRQWRTIFKQRALGKTGRPHPQMLEVMLPLFEECIIKFPAFFKDLSD